MNQRDDLTEELISAYFDGELSADERARVERLLARQGGCQQVLDELKALRDSIRSLPLCALDEGFSGLVLRDAKRAGLLRDEDQGRSPKQSGRAELIKSRPIEAPRRTRWGSLAFAAAVVAASSLIALYWWTAPKSADTAGPPLGSTLADSAVAKRSNTRGESPAKTNPRDDAVNGLAATVEPQQTSQPPETSTRGDSTSLATRSGSVPSNEALEPAAGDGRTQVPMASPSLSADRVADRSAARKETPAAIHLPYLFVIELAIKPAGAGNQAFDEVLANHSVLYDRSLEVDKPLETALLNSRFLEDVVSAAPKELSEMGNDGQRPLGEVELVYMAATSRQVDDVVADLRARQADFAAVGFNLAVKPADVRVFEHLRRAASDQFVHAGQPSRPEEKQEQAVAVAAERLGRARRLIMQVTLLSRSGRTLGMTGMVSHTGPRTAPPSSLPDGSNRFTTSDHLPPGGKPSIAKSDIQYEVLFVLHNQPDVDE